MAEESQSEPESDTTDGSESKPRRRIPGNLTYISNYGSIKSVLDKIETASTPDKFSQDFLATVLKLSGGSFKAVIPVLKRVGFVASDGTPTDLYAKFRTATGRPEAAYQALKNGFAELFRRNEHAYATTDPKLVDLIVETTGLPKDDPVVGAIKGTFRIFTGFLPGNFSAADIGKSAPPAGESEGERHRPLDPPPAANPPAGAAQQPIALAYNINVVIPETKDIEVLNAIFRSLRDNLLRA